MRIICRSLKIRPRCSWDWIITNLSEWYRTLSEAIHESVQHIETSIRDATTAIEGIGKYTQSTDLGIKDLGARVVAKQEQEDIRLNGM